ncbi:hypothetical protein GJAV_G00193580 [Gymnothorax javanicus]|nr:hypothetical protein GJAV_G00193580 [Gymnothorax javanicus]
MCGENRKTPEEGLGMDGGVERQLGGVGFVGELEQLAGRYKPKRKEEKKKPSEPDWRAASVLSRWRCD